MHQIINSWYLDEINPKQTMIQWTSILFYFLPTTRAFHGTNAPNIEVSTSQNYLMYENLII